MQSLSLMKPTNVPVTRLAVRTMPTPAVSRMVVTQPVNLRPMGNTVSMTVPNENPFTSQRAIRVVTQASGGMAKADPTQRTRARFVPGLGGDLGDLQQEAYEAYKKYDTSGQPYDAAKQAWWENEISKQKAASGAAWSKVGDIFTTSLTAASSTISDINKAKIAEQNRLALQAQADIERTRQQAFTSRLTDVSKYGEGMAAQKQITIPLLIIAGGALAVAAFLFMKKKKAA